LTARPRILVIKLGALGDFVQATGCFAAIRTHHRDAEITLLTSPLYVSLGAMSPYFDHVIGDERVGPFRLLTWWRRRQTLRAEGFERVYDLQTSDRSSFYFHLMGPGKRPEWSGIARGASHPHANPRRDAMHALDAKIEQLRMAGIDHVPPPNVSWAGQAMKSFAPPDRFLLLVPGAAPHRPKKRWPVERYAALAKIAAEKGVTSIVIGSAPETPLAQSIVAAVPAAIDLTRRTTIGNLAWLGSRAQGAVGNDTGPMHVLVAAGSPATVLYSGESDPALTAPRGTKVTILRKPELADLSVAEVAATLPFG
jgi:ADP-heptose:LPS heptosyltransferase